MTTANALLKLHYERLMRMAAFTRELIDVATAVNGPSPHWEAERRAEAEACEAGANAIRALTQLSQPQRDPDAIVSIPHDDMTHCLRCYEDGAIVLLEPTARGKVCLFHGLVNTGKEPR